MLNQRRRRWADVVSMSYKVLCLLALSKTLYITPMLVKFWASVADDGLTVKQRLVSVSLE